MWIARAVSKESTETERTEKELSIIDGSLLIWTNFKISFKLILRDLLFPLHPVAGSLQQSGAKSWYHAG